MTDLQAEPGRGDDRHVVATVRAVAIGIVVSTLVLAGAFWPTQGPRFALGVAVGGAIGLLNFLALARIGRAMTAPAGGGLWGLAYLFKVFALFGGAALLLRAGLVPGLGIVVGLCALLPGIVVGGLRAAPGASGR
jgi:hypothetical protein